MKILMLSHDPNILKYGSEAAKRMQEYADVLGELHIIVTGQGMAQYKTNLFIYPAMLRSIGVFITGRKLCRKYKFDALTVQAADDIGLVGFFLAYLFRIPFQLQLHTDVLNSWYRRASWKEWVNYRIAHFLIPRADCIRVVSERIRNSIESRIKNQETKIFVLPIYTDFTKYFTAQQNINMDKRFSDYKFKMIAVGRFVEKEKNFLMLIDVVRDFVSVCPDVLLVIVGEGPDKKNYETSIKNQGLEKNIILESWRNDLPSFYKSFDLFLLSSNYEGWGMVVLEAMASGLPVIMTNVGLAGEVVKNEENGLVVPAGNSNAFLCAVEYLYKNPEKRKKFAEAGMLTVKSLRSHTKEEYLQKYRESLTF